MGVEDPTQGIEGIYLSPNDDFLASHSGNRIHILRIKDMLLRETPSIYAQISLKEAFPLAHLEWNPILPSPQHGT